MVKARENTRQATTYNGNIAHVMYMCTLKKHNRQLKYSTMLSD